MKVEVSVDLCFFSVLCKVDVFVGMLLEEVLESGCFIEIDGLDDFLLSWLGLVGKGC